jgi:EAL domain-containing protein (putative c-di-GMP-specific phosphodiesterase class I)/CHASE2 domain-containing sensor protein
VPKSTNKMVVGWRGLLLTLLAAIAVGASSLYVPLDRALEITTGRFAWRSVSGDIVVVGIDDRTLAQSKYLHFNRIDQANTLAAIDKAGAKSVMLDLQYDADDNYGGLDYLAKTIQSIGKKMVLGVPSWTIPGSKKATHSFPPESFGKEAKLSSLAWDYEFWQVWDAPLMYQAGPKLIPSFAAILANRTDTKPSTFRIDFSYLPESIPHYSAADVLSGTVGPEQLSGKDVIFGSTTSRGNDFHNFPGHDLIAGPFIHVMAAETLRRDMPSNWGWLPPLGVMSALLLIFIVTRRIQRFLIVSASIAAALVVAKLVLSTQLIHISIGPALVYAALLATAVARFRRRLSAQREDPLSGLPNFAALRARTPFQDQIVVIVKLSDFDEMSAYLSSDENQKLVEQVARRLQLATQGNILYHDADGSFAWLAPHVSQAKLNDQLAGIGALFNAPINIDNQRIDVSLAFGIDEDEDSTNSQRIAAAKAAADRAARSRNLWDRSAKSEREDVSWKLSFQSQLDDAMTQGDMWVAYQPQYDISNKRLVGVEALARWTHPKRGFIPPDQFIVQAERTQNIYRLTLFVMDRAIQSGAELYALGHHIGMSVNLSAILLDHDDLPSKIKVMLDAHGLPANLLTIEITETAQFSDVTRAMNTLAKLRQSGIRLSIDDYGTGQSNLEYLTRIEADEIKIDKRFVSTMRDSQRDFEIVKSTIDLAHRLGAAAVAEGIEDSATLALLGKLGCDVGQGYHLGKPQLFFEVVETLNDQSQHRSA